MQLAQLGSWPPASLLRDGPRLNEGVLRRCVFVPKTALVAAHVELTVEWWNRTHQLIYWHTSEVILRRIEATLKDRSGMSMARTGELELAELQEQA